MVDMTQNAGTGVVQLVNYSNQLLTADNSWDQFLVEDKQWVQNNRSLTWEWRQRYNLEDGNSDLPAIHCLSTPCSLATGHCLQAHTVLELIIQSRLPFFCDNVIQGLFKDFYTVVHSERTPLLKLV